MLYRALVALLLTLALALPARADDVVLFSNVAQTTTQTAVGEYEYPVDGAERLSGLLFVFNVFTCTTCNLSVRVQVKDPALPVWVNYATFTAVTSTGSYVYTLAPLGSTTGGGVTEGLTRPVPKRFRVQVVHGNANANSYTLGMTWK